MDGCLQPAALLFLETHDFELLHTRAHAHAYSLSQPTSSNLELSILHGILRNAGKV